MHTTTTLSRTRIQTPVVLAAIGVWILALVPRLVSVGQVSADERAWLARSERYTDAYRALDFTAATTSTTGRGTMPGITTAVLGGFARDIWSVLHDLGLLSTSGQEFHDSRAGLIISQALLAVATATLIVVFGWVLLRWTTPVVALVTTVLLATEPDFVMHGARFTTDMLVTMFGAIGAFALAAALGVPRPRAPMSTATRRRLAVVAGLGLGGAVVSKLSAVALGPFIIGVLVVAWVHARDRESKRDMWTTVLIVGTIALGCVIVLWPALWADPAGQWKVISGSASQTGIARQQLLLGDLTTNPGPLFYPVVMAFRMTPWMLFLAVAAPAVTIALRSSRSHAVTVLAYCVMPAVVISVSTLKYERYALPLWPALALFAGLFFDRAYFWVSERAPSSRRIVFAAAATAILVLFVAAVDVGPDAPVYANPVLGGGSEAQNAMFLDASAMGAVGATIDHLQDRQCGRRVLSFSTSNRLRFPCGNLIHSTRDLRRGDFIVLDSYVERRKGPEKVQQLRKLGRTRTIRTRGVDVADIITVR